MEWEEVCFIYFLCFHTSSSLLTIVRDCENALQSLKVQFLFDEFCRCSCYCFYISIIHPKKKHTHTQKTPHLPPPKVKAKTETKGKKYNKDWKHAEQKEASTGKIKRNKKNLQQQKKQSRLFSQTIEHCLPILN